MNKHKSINTVRSVLIKTGALVEHTKYRCSVRVLHPLGLIFVVFIMVTVPLVEAFKVARELVKELKENAIWW